MVGLERRVEAELHLMSFPVYEAQAGNTIIGPEKQRSCVPRVGTLVEENAQASQLTSRNLTNYLVQSAPLSADGLSNTFAAPALCLTRFVRDMVLCVRPCHARF